MVGVVGMGVTADKQPAVIRTPKYVPNPSQ